MKFHIIAAILSLALMTLPCAAETIKLKDGTVLEGTVIRQGDKYWVKTPDGNSRTIPLSEVEAVGSAAKTDAATGRPAATSDSHEFLATRRRAEAVDTPIAAVSIWQAFIEKSTSESDQQAARAEMDKWQALADGNAEKINGKWVGGAERKALIEKHHALMKQGWDLLRTDQTLPAMKKLEEAAKVYPNSFEGNFLLGYLMMLQHKEDVAKRYFEQALRVRPNSPEALANMGLIQMSKKQHSLAIQTMYRAVQSGDSIEIAQNLINAISWAPPAVQKSHAIKPATEAARLLAVKYGISGPNQQLLLVPLRPESITEKPEDAMAGAMASGTGFVINDEGLILTNRHVVDSGKTIMVVTADKQKRAAEVVVIDEEQDLALIKIKADSEIPFIQFSKLDSPADGAECTVMGYPMLDRLGASIKITRGIVSSASNQSGMGADVLIDAKVNPGNSGGPILDRFGNVMAIVSMKSLATASEESYGMGISAGRVREFLVKNKVTVSAADPGTIGLSAEEIAAKVKPATVCILVTY